MSGKQIELFSITNPCVGICQSNPRGYCIGCLRSREERFNWHLKTQQEQRKIIQLLAQRKARLRQQHTAHNNSVNEQNPSIIPAQASLFELSPTTDKNLEQPTDDTYRVESNPSKNTGQK